MQNLSTLMLLNVCVLTLTNFTITDAISYNRNEIEKLQCRIILVCSLTFFKDNFAL